MTERRQWGRTRRVLTGHTFRPRRIKGKMAVLLVTYQIQSPATDESLVAEAIKGGNAWWHYIKNVWIVDTFFDVNTLSANIRQHMHDNDWLLVVKITAEHQGWLPADAWDWLNKRIYI